LNNWSWQAHKDKLYLLGSLIFFFLALAPLMAEASWSPSLKGNKFLPSLFFVVNKDTQNLFLFSNQSPLQEVWHLPCTTGQVRGDKLREGDKKTPEGVYFLESKLTQNLDYFLYGGVAFTLNYPNPIDRLKGKTGHGIWIHGRGQEIQAFNTQGCVAVNLKDIPLVEKHIVFAQTPVIITKNFSWAPGPEKDQEAQTLVKKIEAWAKNWRLKSKDFFSFYSSVAYIEGKKSFKSFQRQKERLFEAYPWIDVYLRDIKVVSGPDYKVTYFKQYFRSPNLTSTGIKRLYWQKQGQEWKISGEEWRSLPSKELEEEYLQTRRGEILNWLVRWVQSWQKGDLESYIAFYDPQAKQGNLIGRKKIYEHKQTLWQSDAPKRVYLGNLEVTLHPRGFKVSGIQEYESLKGYKDRGVKKIILVPSGLEFKIWQEDWKKIK